MMSGKMNEKRAVMMLIMRGPLLFIHQKKDYVALPYHFKKKGYEAFLFCWLKAQDAGESVRVIELAEGFPEYFKLGRLHRDITDIIILLRLGCWIRKIRPSLIISYSYPPVIFATKLFLKVFRVKATLLAKMDWDGTVTAKGVRKLYEKCVLLPLLLFADRVCVESFEALEKVSLFVPFLKPKLRVIPSGVSKELIEKVPNVPRKKIILTVARVSRIKGLEVLLKAFANLKRKDWRLVIVGPIHDVEYLEELTALSESLKISNKVTFTGETSDEKLAEWYGKASIFCLPSYNESCNSAMLEAMNAGIPMVVTKTGGSEYANGAGMVVEVGDIDGLSKALEHLIKHPNIRKEKGKLGVKIGQRFFWENICDQWVQVVNK